MIRCNILRGLIPLALLTMLLVSPVFAGKQQRPAALKNKNPLWLLEKANNQLLDNTFRIDIRTITVKFNYYPAQSLVQCEARVEFHMRPGQRHPLIHLDPVLRNPRTVDKIRLDDEALDIFNPDDVRTVTMDGSTQQALKFQRDLNPIGPHLLEISYRLYLSKDYPAFCSGVTDIYGIGNEERFPCINSPEDLARHVFTFTVHSTVPYRFMGSGLVRKSETRVQQWTLDSEREISSYTLMFMLLPEADTRLESRTVNGVDVRIMAFHGGADIDTAFSYLEQSIPQLAAHLGPFPMPRGFRVFLVGRGGGMEYYGGAVSSVGALNHELFHMYFGCSTVLKTYRDSWLDEAVNMWYHNSVRNNYPAVAENFRSNIVSGRSPAAVGFDVRAYSQGAKIIEAVARALGGRDKMIAFLAFIHNKFSYAPFSTMDFLDYLREYAGVTLTGRFMGWLYTGDCNEKDTNLSSLRNSPRHLLPDMTPPETVLKKYRSEKLPATSNK